jgi:Tfp pilus assembly protein PilO
MVLTIGVVVLALVLTYFFLVRSRRGQLDQVNEQIAAEEVSTVALTTELTRLRALQKQAPQLRAALDKFTRLVPEDYDIPEFILQVQEVSARSGLDFVKITPELPKPPPETAEVAEVRMTLGAKGGYFAVQDFMRRLYELERAFRIDNFTMTGEQEPDGGTTVIRMEATARIFFQGAVTAPAATTTTTTTAPATTATPAPSPTS